MRRLTQTSLLNPEAPEFSPENLGFLPNNIITQNHYYFHTLFSFSAPNSQPFFLPPPLPPTQLFPTSYHHNQTAVVVADLHHHHHQHDQDRDFGQPRNHNRRFRFSRRRGRGGLSNWRTRRGSSWTEGRSSIRANVNHGQEVRVEVSMRRVLREGDHCNNVVIQQQYSSSDQVFPLMHAGNETTVMIRNVPSKYTRQMLLDFLDDYCMLQNQRILNNDVAGEDDHHPISAFDFLYLPMDFRTELNKGYAFVNFTSPEAASKFSEATNGQTWDHFQSSKIRNTARARLQGKDELKRHFESMAFPCGNEEFLPVLFIPPRDGTNKDSVTQTTVGKLIGKRRRGIDRP